MDARPDMFDKAAAMCQSNANEALVDRRKRHQPEPAEVGASVVER
jgi:hypothetical protein